MAPAHFTTKPCEPNKANRHIESHILFVKFVPVVTTLCMLGLKILDLFFAFLCVIFFGWVNHITSENLTAKLAREILANAGRWTVNPMGSSLSSQSESVKLLLSWVYYITWWILTNCRKARISASSPVVLDAQSNSTSSDREDAPKSKHPTQSLIHLILASRHWKGAQRT